MKNNIYDLSSYSFSSDDQILLDANVWLYLFPAPTSPTNKKNYVGEYSNALKKIANAKAQCVLDPMVLSEYLNRYIRIEWEVNYKSSHPKYKENFRKSLDFLKVASKAKVYAEKILSCCQIHSLPSNELDLQQALNVFSKGDKDFNDALLVDICKKRNLKLMTHDCDFQYGGIEVLTVNQRLLKSCS